MEQLQVSHIYTNAQIADVFGCSTQGGMRRSLSTNSLILISKHIHTIYDDQWIDEVLHYTGMGQSGDQSLDFMQNKTLAESRENGVSLHLFEVFNKYEYIYAGEVRLDEEPYFSLQRDKDGVERKVAIFPLRLIKSSPLTVEKPVIDAIEEYREKRVATQPDAEVERRAHTAIPAPSSRKIVAKQFTRNPWVSEHAKRRAAGICQLCMFPAPFKNNSGVPYLETHHIVWMSAGGEDTPENTVALCPNCHKKMHIINNPDEVEMLKKRVKEI